MFGSSLLVLKKNDRLSWGWEKASWGTKESKKGKGFFWGVVQYIPYYKHFLNRLASPHSRYFYKSTPDIYSQIWKMVIYFCLEHHGTFIWTNPAIVCLEYCSHLPPFLKCWGSCQNHYIATILDYSKADLPNLDCKNLDHH